MILGIEELLNLVREKKLVENLSERELNSPEGAGFDLRIGELYQVESKGFLGIEERETPQMKLLAKYEEGKVQKVSLAPQTYYVMQTAEKLNLPDNVLALFVPRSTLYRSGVYIFSGEASPGYQGGLTFGIYNFRKEPFELEMGARVAHVMFFEVKAKGSLYRGQWQGGRVTTDKKEKQI